MRTALLYLTLLLWGGLSAMAQSNIVHPASNRDPHPGPTGEKPYEMEGRLEERTPLVNFQDVTGWEVAGTNAEGWLFRTEERKLYGEYCGKLTFVARGENASILVRPAQPIPLPEPWDAINFWNWGNNWGWVPDPTTPPQFVSAVVRDANGTEFDIPLGSIDYQYWFMMHAPLPEAMRAPLKRPASFVGLRFSQWNNKEPRTIYLGPLYFYPEELMPLEFPTWPKVLPFPTRTETILPMNKSKEFKNWVDRGTDLLSDIAFEYLSSEGNQFYSYKPTDGTLGDIRVVIEKEDGPVFRPFVGGGVELVTPKGILTPDDPTVERTLLASDTNFYSEDDIRYTAKWRLRSGDVSTDLTYKIRIEQKSLIIDMEASNPVVERVSLGRAEPVRDPKLIWIPYWTYGAGGRNDPHVLYTDGHFVASQFDWFVSNASILHGAKGLGPNWAAFNGDAQYLPKTDGTRNVMRERLVLTVSPDVQEVLPTVPNPKSPFQSEQGRRLWRVKSGADGKEELAEAKMLRARGCDQVTIRFHEDTWRDAGESFTFRLNSAPKHWGDAALKQFVSDIKALGWRVGLYTNYTDYAPVNSAWNEDWVNRLPDGSWQRAWPRCYAPKPMRAVEAEAYFAPRLHAKFGENHSYCDVHTAVSPFDRVDYDARVPGAAMFRRTFECFGRLLYNEKTAHQGPVYSEGTNHWWYAGLTDGNYAQLNHYAPYQAPLLVDFDLLKLHPLEMDAGMGAPDMFFRGASWNLDQFIATTLAYGHIGFFEWNTLEGTLKIYYLLQQIQSRYAMMEVTRIEYEHEGKLIDSSTALATGAYLNNRVHVVYENGTEVYVNGHPESWYVIGPDEQPCELPQWGFLAWRDVDQVIAASMVMPVASEIHPHGPRRRVDVAGGKNYYYLDSRGGYVYHYDCGVEGSAVLKQDKGAWWIIPTTVCRDFAFQPDLAGFGHIKDIEVEGVGEKGEISAATNRWSRGLLHVLPNSRALKYRLRKSDQPRPAMLTCSEVLAISDRTIRFSAPNSVSLHTADAFWEIDGARTPAMVTNDDKEFICTLPKTVTSGKHLWLGIPAEGGTRWLDFIAAEPCELSLSLPPAMISQGERVTARVEVRNNLPEDAVIPITVSLPGASVTPESTTLTLPVGEAVSLEVELTLPWRRFSSNLIATAHVGTRPVSISIPVEADLLQPPYAVLTDTNLPVTSGFSIRGRQEQLGLTSGYDGSFYPSPETCGGVERTALFAHPPWGEQRAGYVFNLYALTLPAGSHPELSFFMGIRDGYQSTDGTIYKVAVIDAQGTATELFSQQYNQHVWTPVTVDLSRYAGQSITLKLITDCGPADDTNADHSLWGEPVLRDAAPQLRVRTP